MSAWTCPRCGRAFAARRAHACNRQAPEAFLAPYPDALPLYRAVRRALATLGKVSVEATRTQIAFGAPHRFAFLWIPQMSLHRGPPDVYLAFDLRRRVRSPRIKQSVEARRGLWTHHMRLAKPEDVDDEALAWLREAREVHVLPQP